MCKALLLLLSESATLDASVFKFTTFGFPETYHAGGTAEIKVRDSTGPSIEVVCLVID